MTRNIEYLVLGSRGLVGSAVCRLLKHRNKSFYGASRADVNILDKDSISKLFSKYGPRVIVSAAARVGGIRANNEHPVEFLSENILAQTYLMECAHEFDIKKFVFLGSSCIYPKLAKQPISESSLLTGPLETTNEGYAIAKIAGVKLVQSYRREFNRRWISVMPTNLYGINDNFDLTTSHVLPALMRKFHDAKIREEKMVEVWGTGLPRREFMNSDDFAEALLYVIEKYDDDEPINIGTGIDISIRELVDMMREVVGFEGKVTWNTSMPDGTIRKVLDVTKLNNLGWYSQRTISQGLNETYEWFRKNYHSARLKVEIS